MNGMKTNTWRIAGLTITVLLAAAVLIVMVAKLGPWSAPIGSMSSAVAQEPSVAAMPLSPATNLRIQVQESMIEPASLLDPEDSAWNQATPTAIILNRTPRIYQTEPARDYRIPRCEVRALRSGGKLILRLNWDDPTKNAPEAPAAKSGESGKAEHLYKRPTGETSAFADAAAVMIPDNWTGPSFPSLLMGDKHTPAILYYWNASRGAAELVASGRATPQPNGQTFPFRAHHSNNQWTLTMAIPNPRDSYPIAFAIWDGQLGDRDGLKFFSIWHVLTWK
jgi:hypothetical protein